MTPCSEALPSLARDEQPAVGLLESGVGAVGCFSPPGICCHTFRASGDTEYMRNGASSKGRRRYLLGIHSRGAVFSTSARRRSDCAVRGHMYLKLGTE